LSLFPSPAGLGLADATAICSAKNPRLVVRNHLQLLSFLPETNAIKKDILEKIYLEKSIKKAITITFKKAKESLKNPVHTYICKHLQ